MSVVVCTEINRRLRAAGITVREARGWEERGNGQMSAYEGGLIHHTASGYAVAIPGTGIGKMLIEGRPDLRGPLCNYAGNDDGSVTIIAAHPANHAGASGGRSMGPLPVTTLFNRRVLGLEIVYPGISPMRPAQYRTALIWSRIVADVVGRGDIERVRAHAETSVTGKWDPGVTEGRTIDMAAFRRAARTILQEDDLQYTDPWDDDALNALGPNKLGHALKNIKDNVAATRALVTTQGAAITALAKLVAASDTNDLTEAQVRDAVRSEIANAIIDVDVTVGGQAVENGGTQ
jgi:hypothetical protein